MKDLSRRVPWARLPGMVLLSALMSMYGLEVPAATATPLVGSVPITDSSAAPVLQPPRKAEKLILAQKNTMHSVAIDSVADSPNGQAVVALADGSEIPVSRDVARAIRANKVDGASHSSPSKRVQPVNVNTADCGSSYLFLYETSEGVLMRTGFDVHFHAFGYAWAPKCRT
jgi:hypothetical protein